MIKLFFVRQWHGASDIRNCLYQQSLLGVNTANGFYQTDYLAYSRRSYAVTGSFPPPYMGCFTRHMWGSLPANCVSPITIRQGLSTHRLLVFVFARLFCHVNPTTAEISGSAPALATGYALDILIVCARKTNQKAQHGLPDHHALHAPSSARWWFAGVSARRRAGVDH